MVRWGEETASKWEEEEDEEEDNLQSSRRRRRRLEVTPCTLLTRDTMTQVS